MVLKWKRQYLEHQDKHPDLHKDHHQDHHQQKAKLDFDLHQKAKYSYNIQNISIARERSISADLPFYYV